MLSTRDADRAWKGMAKSMPTQEVPGGSPTTGTAGQAYAALFHEAARPAVNAGIERWLLLRDRTGRDGR
ncbi:MULTISPECIES: hypothetical protein [unclassified Streptomyces]|uniref:hypothetical protein n=1 Tax=unclassified Streptomyces TaxID=2593676 RepID=UPI00274059DC|nr:MULTISPECIES: hypothetical protein [unclassified Streptomyces]